MSVDYPQKTLKKILWLLAAIPLGKIVSEIITYLFPIAQVSSLADASLSSALIRAILPAIVVGYCISRALKTTPSANTNKPIEIELKTTKKVKLSERDQNYQLVIFLKITVVFLLVFIMFVVLNKE
jgi:hypothetical protein